VTDSLFQSFPKTCIGDVTLLGAPLFPGPSLDRAWSHRCAELARASCSLSQTGAQEALIFLRGSFSAPKVLHLLRCSPSVSHSALPEFDKLLRQGTCNDIIEMVVSYCSSWCSFTDTRITNSSLTDTQWLQASLPIKDGGLGVRRVSSLALPAFWRRWRAPLCSKLRSWPIAMFRKILTGRTIYSCGRHPEMRRQTPFL